MQCPTQCVRSLGKRKPGYVSAIVTCRRGGKLNQVVVTAIARELAGFVWSIACITTDPPAKNSAITTAPEKVCQTGSTVRSSSQPVKETARRAGRPGQTRAASPKEAQTE